MRRLLILITILLFSLATTVQAAVVDRIAAVVNNDIITTYALDQAVAAKTQGNGETASSAGADAGLRRKVLNQLIDQDLFQQKIKELGIRVSDQEVKSAIQDVAKQNHLSLAQLKAALQAQGMSLAAYRKTLRKQILQFKLVGREVRSKVEVTHRELLAYYQKHIENYREKPTVQISDITFPLPEKASGDQVEAARQKALQARARIQKGETFAAVLKDAAKGGALGGDLGTFTPGQLTPVFARAIAKLKKGGVSQVVQTSSGFHILKVTGLTPGKVRKFDTVKNKISQTLMEQKTKDRYQKWLEGLKKKAYIDIRL